MLYEQLKNLIDEENQHYRVFNDRIQAATSEDEVSELRTKKISVHQGICSEALQLHLETFIRINSKGLYSI